MYKTNLCRHDSKNMEKSKRWTEKPGITSWENKTSKNNIISLKKIFHYFSFKYY
jgi:hypothetical protein